MHHTASRFSASPFSHFLPRTFNPTLVPFDVSDIAELEDLLGRLMINTDNFLICIASRRHAKTRESYPDLYVMHHSLCFDLLLSCVRNLRNLQEFLAKNMFTDSCESCNSLSAF